MWKSFSREIFESLKIPAWLRDDPRISINATSLPHHPGPYFFFFFGEACMPILAIHVNISIDGGIFGHKKSALFVVCGAPLSQKMGEHGPVAPAACGSQPSRGLRGWGGPRQLQKWQPRLTWKKKGRRSHPLYMPWICMVAFKDSNAWTSIYHLWIYMPKLVIM